MKSGNLNLLEHSESVQACTGTVLPFISRGTRCGSFLKMRLYQSPQNISHSNFDKIWLSYFFTAFMFFVIICFSLLFSKLLDLMFFFNILYMFVFYFVYLCFCVVLCVVSPIVYSYLFLFFLQFHRPLPPGGHTIALHKYHIISHNIISFW